MREKEFAKAQDLAQEKAYAEQTEAITRMRGLLEDENERKR